MPTPKPSWDPRWRNASQEKPRVNGLNRVQLEAEHMEMFAALLHIKAKLEDLQTPGSTMRAWSAEHHRIRNMGNAMRDAIESGNMADRMREMAAWDDDPFNATD